VREKSLQLQRLMMDIGHENLPQYDRKSPTTLLIQNTDSTLHIAAATMTLT
jgi:hypothetical protein